MTQTMLKTALRYLENGFSIIPVRANKKPLVPWEEFQKRRATEEEVQQWFKKYNVEGIALITGSISGVVVIDVDDPSIGEIDRLLKPEEESNPLELSDYQTPMAITPRGGLHIFFAAPTPPLPNNSRIVPGCDFRGEGGYVLVDPSPGYSWFPGSSIFELKVPMLPKAYIDYVLLRGGFRGGNIGVVATEIPEGQRNEAAFHLATRLVRGGASFDEVRIQLKIFNNACNPPLSEKELQITIESAFKHQSKREIPLAEEVRSNIEQQDGDFSVTSLYQDMTVVTKSDKSNIRKILQRLKEEGLIERIGTKSGVYRRIEREFEYMDLSVDAPEFNIEFPLGVHELVRIMPKNIIVVAGQSNAGKTAFLLSLAEKNLGKYPIRYLSSEMGPLELKTRLKEFKTPMSKWQEIFVERVNHFADLILPDALTIVDYLEVSDEFYRIGGMIKEIFDRLTIGVAIIALQKNAGTDLGLGGARSIEKARLYLSIDHGVLKIVKGKNWRSIQNPSGKSIRFRLHRGAEFEAMSEWGYEKEE